MKIPRNYCMNLPNIGEVTGFHSQMKARSIHMGRQRLQPENPPCRPAAWKRICLGTAGTPGPEFFTGVMPQSWGNGSRITGLFSGGQKEQVIPQGSKHNQRYQVAQQSVQSKRYPCRTCPFQKRISSNGDSHHPFSGNQSGTQ